MKVRSVAGLGLVVVLLAFGATACDPPLLRPGDHGPDVLALQQELVSHGFWLGATDANYSDATTHAVVAFQKSVGLARDGVAGPNTRKALKAAARLVPRSWGGHVFEV